MHLVVIGVHPEVNFFQFVLVFRNGCDYLGELQGFLNWQVFATLRTNFHFQLLIRHTLSLQSFLYIIQPDLTLLVHSFLVQEVPPERFDLS